MASREDPEVVSYEDVLGVLLGAVGTRVGVGIMGVVPAGMGPPTIAHMAGTLVGGTEVDEQTGDVFGLGFEESPEAFWMLDRRAFRGAGWYDDEQTCLLIQVGSVGILLDLDP